MKNLFPHIFLGIFVSISSVVAETGATQEIADRYEQLLISSPQPGASFDRVVDWYATQGGGLEMLQQRWEKGADEPTKRRSYWILQGLLAEKMHNASKARALYLKSLADGNQPAQPGRLLAALETREGNFPAAADAYLKALAEESLAPVDRMEIMRSLALLYQRSFQDDKALAVWQDAIKRYPDDTYVLEEAGEALLAAGNYEEARKTFTRLRDASATDPFRKVAASLRLARTSELEGKTDEAVHTYELALAETSEGSWLNREVRNRIEELFRRKDDLPGLLAYYEKRIAAVPQDHQSLAAQATVLDDLVRGNEAIERIRAATVLAPENVELRLSLIRRLDTQGQLETALTEAEELAKSPQASTEVLLTLGNLYWSSFEKTGLDKARENALTAWRRIAPEKSSDLALISQLADIFASHEQTDAALAEWLRIIKLEPTAADARQKAAEIYKKRDGKNAALAVLNDLVTEERSQPENFLLLARIQERLEFTEESRANIAKALALFPQNYEILSFGWRQAIEAKDAKLVETLFAPLWKNAPNEFFSDDAVKRYVSFLDAQNLGKEKIKELTARLSDSSDAPPTDALVLLRFALTQQDQELAKTALAAMKKQADPVRILRASSEVAQVFGSSDERIAALKAIAAADPRTAQDSLQSIARIQAEAGNADEALATVSQLIERSPADGALYSFYADLASRTGKFDLAVARLTEGVRYVENANTLRLQLAGMLQAQERNADAAKVLQEAFQTEEQEGRRMEIFRRQVDLAGQSGTLDDLIATLKEKQGREQNGARYGAYLAEIYLQQNNLLAASEELKRSLGHNPANPGAVSRLLDLADRSGDQAESLRLAARLMELQPSLENRVAYISRLFETNDLARAKAEFEKVRPEILKNLTGWGPLLTVARKAGMKAECDQIVIETATAAGSEPEPLTELANLYLQQRNYDAAEKTLWAILEIDGLADSITVIAQDRQNVNAANFGISPYYQAAMPFSQLVQEVQNSIQQMFYPGSGRNFRNFSSFRGMATTTTAATPRQKAQVRALYTLSVLAGARQREDSFFPKAREILNRNHLSRDIQLMVLGTLNDLEGLKTIARQQAEDPQGSPEMDKFIIGLAPALSPDLKEVVETLQARVAKTDPAFAFAQLLVKTYTDFPQFYANPNVELDAATKARLQERLDILVNHPGLGDLPIPRLQVAALVARVGDVDTAWKLFDQAKSKVAEAFKNGGQTAQMTSSYWFNAQGTLLAQSIRLGRTDAKARFEDLLKEWPKQMKTLQPNYSFSSFSRRGMANSPLAQDSAELMAGDSEFPINIFRMLQPGQPNSNADHLQKWFAKNVGTTGLDIYAVGQFYGDWFSGNKDEAIKRLEAIHSKNPTPRGAALLLEVYEKTKAADKALALIDLAELQQTETLEVRNIRRLRLLRIALRTDEARALAEKLSKGRISNEVREPLLAELNTLGIPTNKLPGLQPYGGSSRSRSSTDRASQLSTQLRKLVADKKTEDAERIVLAILQKPLPEDANSPEANLRNRMVNEVRSLKLLDGLEVELQGRITKNPQDIDALIRLMELHSNDEKQDDAERLAQALIAHPESAKNVGYGLNLLQRSPGGTEKAGPVICALLRAGSDYLLNGGIQLQEIRNLTSQPDTGLLLAETINGLSEENYRKLFLPSRLMRQMDESPFLSQLAEFASQGNQPELAISLLKKAIPQVGMNQMAGIPVALRLTELQLANGQATEASETMKSLLTKQQGSRLSMYGNYAMNLGSYFLNFSYNRMNQNNGDDTLKRLSDLAEKTGNFNLLVKTLEETLPKTGSIPPSLLVRTILERPDIVKEWRTLLSSKTDSDANFNYSLFTNVATVFAKEPDAAKLLPAFLRRIPEVQYVNFGSEQSLSVLSETVPIITKFRADPVVKKHVELLLARVRNDSNARQYLVSSQSYPRALNVLLENSYLAEARELFNLTTTARAANNSGNRPTFARIEAVLRSLDGKSNDLQVISAAIPIASDRLAVNWKTILKVDADPDGSSAPPAIWEESDLLTPKKNLPTTLEIYAGANPSRMQKVTQIAKPPVSGRTEIKITDPIGLLQTRWKTADGKSAAGPLIAYVAGENLIKQNGFIESNKSYRPGTPGPLGSKSAVVYAGSSPRSELLLPLAEIPLDGTPRRIVLTGWLKGDGFNGNPPGFNLKFVKENGRVENDQLYANSAPGQWRQVYKVWTVSPSDSGNRLDQATRKMVVSLKMNASQGYNSSFIFNAAWDGLQLVILPISQPAIDANQLISKARDAESNQDYPQSAELCLQALRLTPSVVTDQGDFSLNVCKKAGRLAEVFQILANPALYAANPLAGGNATLSSENSMTLLVEAASASDAPATAKDWLEVVQNAPLSESTRLTIQTALLQGEILHNPDKIQPEKLLAMLGFPGKEANAPRLRQLWNGSASSKSPYSILDIVDKRKLNQSLRELVEKIVVPRDLQSAQQLLAAWLTAPDAPDKALQLWRQSLALRANENSANFSSDADRAFLLRMARSSASPGDVVAAAKSWLVRQGEQQRVLLEIIYAAAISDSPRHLEYAPLWADAELAAMKSADYRPSRDRVRELARRLMEAKDWDRLDSLLALSEKNTRLQDSTLQRELTQLKDIVRLARGDYSNAWPIAWSEPTDKPQKVIIHWQWNIRDVIQNEGKYDNAISVAEKPPLSEITNQTAVEILFGEMPSEMKPIGRREGNSATGNLPLSLPAPNGFLRAVAIIGGQRLSGPMVPILSGKRIYPAPGEALKTMLTTGKRPLPAQLIVENGASPDRSPVIRIGEVGGNRDIAYEGRELPAQPDKFYVSRSWMRRVGDGSGSISSLFKGKTAADAPSSLNMLLISGREATTQWTLYNRAVPSFSEHTFWIKSDTLQTMTPCLAEWESGSEIAGWELLEIGNWKYAQWIGDLARLRQGAGKSPTADTVEQAATLAANEPLTSLDYHSDWLAPEMVRLGKGTQMLDLYARAFEAEPNPLFAKPKLDRIFRSLLTLIDDPALPDDLRTRAIQLGLKNCHFELPTNSWWINVWLALRVKAISGGAGKNQETLDRVRTEVLEQLADKTRAADFVQFAIQSRDYIDERPSNNLLLLTSLLEDGSLVASLSSILQARNIGLDTSEKVFVALAFEMCAKNTVVSDSWKEKITTAYALTGKSKAPDRLMFWPAILGDLLASRKAPPEVLLHLRREGFDRMERHGSGDSGTLNELTRTAWFLIETQLAQNDKTGAQRTADQLLAKLPSHENSLPIYAVRNVFHIVDLLAAASLTENTRPLLQLVEKDVRNSPELLESYGKYFQP